MKRFKSIIMIISLISIVVFTGCTSQEPLPETSETNRNTPNEKLVITEDFWWDGGSKSEEITFDAVHKGDILAENDFGSLTVDTVTEHKIVIKIDGGFVEKTGDGINLQADPLTKIKLNAGESIKIVSQSMDAGVTITVTFH